jgi:hypothetical protein
MAMAESFPHLVTERRIAKSRDFEEDLSAFDTAAASFRVG